MDRLTELLPTASAGDRTGLAVAGIRPCGAAVVVYGEVAGRLMLITNARAIAGPRVVTVVKRKLLLAVRAKDMWLRPLLVARDLRQISRRIDASRRIDPLVVRSVGGSEVASRPSRWSRSRQGHRYRQHEQNSRSK